MGKPVALSGHMHTCPNCAPRPHVGGPVIITGQTWVKVSGRPIATVGDKCMCTGVPVMDEITTGSASISIGGRKVARKGDKCAHGGEIVEGVDWLTFD